MTKTVLTPSEARRKAHDEIVLSAQLQTIYDLGADICRKDREAKAKRAMEIHKHMSEIRQLIESSADLCNYFDDIDYEFETIEGKDIVTIIGVTKRGFKFSIQTDKDRVSCPSTYNALKRIALL